MYDKKAVEKAWSDCKEARELHMAERNDEAIAICQSVRDNLPERETAYKQASFIKAAAHFQLGQFSDALLCWEKIEIPQGFVKTLRKKAQAHLQLKQHGKALECYEKLETPTKEDRDNMITCLEVRCQHHINQRQYTRALRDAIKMKQLDSHYLIAKWLDHIGLMQELQKRREERKQPSAAFFRTESTSDISRTPPPKRARSESDTDKYLDDNKAPQKKC